MVQFSEFWFSSPYKSSFFLLSLFFLKEEKSVFFLNLESAATTNTVKIMKVAQKARDMKKPILEMKSEAVRSVSARKTE